jgi:hypothetical protein
MTFTPNSTGAPYVWRSGRVGGEERTMPLKKRLHNGRFRRAKHGLRVAQVLARSSRVELVG